MSQPVGATAVAGVVNRRSPLPVSETVDRLTEAIGVAGAKVFALIDHSGEAKAAGLSLRDTKLLVFGSPAAGTAVMQAAPLSALDLPLKILVWTDDGGTVWMSYISPEWLAGRHGIPADLTKPLSAVEMLVSRIADAT
jgi:uncharacterized protein (DUF302 family)